MENDFVDRLGALAHLETIRSARIEALNLRNNIKGSLNTTSEVLKLPKLRPARIHVFTNLCAIEVGTGKPQLFFYILVGGEKYYIHSATVTTAEDSVNWSGQVIALEGNEICVEAQGATAADELVFTGNGYSMRL